MDCRLIQPDLVAYHFGVIADDERSNVEQHLLGCPSCLKDYLSIKREIETSEVKPSMLAKARLKKAVAAELASHRPRVRWSWWERPLAVGCAAASVMLAIFAVQWLRTGDGTAPHAWTATVTASPPASP